MLFVKKIATKSFGDRRDLRANIQYDSMEDQLWFQWRGPACPCPGNAVLTAVLPLAMRLGQNLIFQDEASAWLVEALDRLQTLYGRIDPLLTRVEVHIEEVTANDSRETAGTGPGAPIQGAFYNGSLEAIYILADCLDDIESLLSLQRFQVSSTHRVFNGKGHHWIDHAASELGKKRCHVETNLADLFGTDREPGKPEQLAAVQVAGLLHAGRVAGIYMPTGPWPDAGPPPGIENELTAIFSQGQTWFRPHRPDIDRQDMIDKILNTPAVLDTLRVCWENPSRAYNCGRCPTCTRRIDPRTIVNSLI